MVVHCVCNAFLVYFFFKQKTAYEMRISDWSSDVCSSDLIMMQRTCQGRRAKLGHFMLGANLAYLGGHQAGPFGNDPGRPTLSVFVRQRNRVMSRVGDNDVSTRYLGPHAPPRHGALLLSNAELGRAACGERVGQAVSIAGGAGT